jgi:hypothetical protein
MATQFTFAVENACDVRVRISQSKQWDFVTHIREHCTLSHFMFPPLNHGGQQIGISSPGATEGPQVTLPAAPKSTKDCPRRSFRGKKRRFRTQTSDLSGHESNCKRNQPGKVRITRMSQFCQAESYLANCATNDGRVHNGGRRRRFLVYIVTLQLIAINSFCDVEICGGC